MKNAILEEIDKLKLMVMMDNGIPEKTDLQRYQDWVEEMQCRKSTCSHYPFTHCSLCDPTKYAEYRTIKSLVDRLYEDKHGHTYAYEKDKPEIHRMIADVVAMTIFIQQEVR